MYTNKTRIKTLCKAFALPETSWLPQAVMDLLVYLLTHPSSFMEGDILYLNCQEETTYAQLLTILADKGEIIVERPLIIDNSGCLLAGGVSLWEHKKLVSYAAEYGLYNNEAWNLNWILLKAGRSSDQIEKIIEPSPQPITVMTIADETVISAKIAAGNDTRQAFNAILLIYPRHLFIEKISADPEVRQLERIPFASENLVLDITQRCKIFSFSANSEYNLADDKNLLLCRIYEQNFIDSEADQRENPLLSLEHQSHLGDRDTVVELYLNLPHNCLEIAYASNQADSTDNLLQDWQQQQQAGYELISSLPFVDSRLIADYGHHLKREDLYLPQNISKTVYYKALTLLNILCAKK